MACFYLAAYFFLGDFVRWAVSILKGIRFGFGWSFDIFVLADGCNVLKPLVCSYPRFVYKYELMARHIREPTYACRIGEVQGC